MRVTFLLAGLPMIGAMLLLTRLVWTGHPSALVGVVLLGVVWAQVDADFEGPVVLHLTADHGVVLADLLVPVVLAAAGAGWLCHRRSSRRRRDQLPSERRPGALDQPTAVGDRG